MNREKWYQRVYEMRQFILYFDWRPTLCKPLDWLMTRMTCCETCNDYHAPHCNECHCGDCMPF